MLNEINRQAEKNKAEQDVNDAERAYVASIKRHECKQYEAPGKTVRDLVVYSTTVLVVFTDGTYLHYEANHDYEGTELLSNAPAQQDCETYGIGDPVARATLERARQIAAVARRKDEYMTKMAQLVREIGKENILKLLKETK